MLKIENTEVMGWEHAIRGMRNPKNSWEKTDSYPAVDCGKCGKIERERIFAKKRTVIVRVLNALKWARMT
jgi:hypothetical protein